MSANPRTYSADFSSPVTGGGSDQTINLRITNVGTQDLGSADITPPAGIVFTAVSGPGSSLDTAGIHLRNLNLAGGSFLDYTITANISCPARTVNWGNPLQITAHRDNNGGGQAFNLDTAQSDLLTAVQQACTLISISTQPNHAQAGQTITNTAYDPTGSKVTVVARNNVGLAPLVPSNDQVTLGKTAGLFTSGGTGFTGNAVTLSNAAQAVFTALQSGRTGLGFKLTATATGYFPSLASNSFDIQVDGTRCQGASCSVDTGNQGHTKNKVDGADTANGDTLGVGLIEFDAPPGPDVFQIPDNVCSTGPFVPLPDSSGFTTSMQLGVTGSGTSQPDWTLAATLDKFIMNQIPLNGAAQSRAASVPTGSVLERTSHPVR